MLALALCALVVLLPAALSRVVEISAGPGTGEAWPTDVHGEPVPVQQLGAAPKPVANQKRAPCTEGLEVELSGACWLWLGQKPPQCPPQAVAYEGRCLLPVATPRPVPSSVDGGEQR